MAEKGTDMDIPDLVSDSDEIDEGDDDDGWDDVEDDEEEELDVLRGNVKCLFCENVETSVDAVLSHCTQDHNFDLVSLSRKRSIDCIGYIKLINYIRKKNPSSEDVVRSLYSGQTQWSSDEFMHAVEPEDLMLQFDIEWAQCHSKDRALTEKSKSIDAPDSPHSGSSYSESEAIGALVDRIHRTEEQRNFFEGELNRALETVEKLKLSGQQLFMDGGDAKEDDKLSEVNGVSLGDEDGYFASYSHHGIHLTMLQDKVRTESYRDFMLKNPHMFEGKTVLDVGCGTGILSMFAAKAGAEHVVAVDQSNIIYQAMDIARENKLHEKITFVRGRLEDVNLPIEKFDVIISEWMGYFLLFEAMLDSVLWARDHYLKPGGCVYPDHFTMSVVGVSDPGLRKAKLEFWDDVYGFKMSCMKSSVIEEVLVKTVKKETVVTEPAVIKDIDVMKCTVKDLDFSADFTLRPHTDSDITAFVGYFDTDFVMGCHHKVSFSTGPHATPTHWEQAVMLLPTPLSVKKDKSLDCRITYRKHPNDTRGVIITLCIGKQTFKYSLS